MKSQELQSALTNNTATRNVVTGVYAANTVPPVFSKLPAACIINTDPSSRPGEHWIALYQEVPDVIEFFDSFGKDPSYHKLDLEILSNKRIIKQDRKIQSDITTVCGQYCLFFIACRCGGKSFSQIVNVFSNSNINNDIVVLSFTNRHFSLNGKLIDCGFILE